MSSAHFITDQEGIEHMFRSFEEALAFWMGVVMNQEMGEWRWSS